MKTLFSLLIVLSSAVGVVNAGQPEKLTFEQYLRKHAVSKEAFGNGNIYTLFSGPSTFDPELGWIMQSSSPRDGIDNSLTLQTYRPNGTRASFVYPGKLPRINTYGDSYTAGAQVSDSETWQEYLGGHLGEPIRNFGVGSYGVHQSYRRMIREEKTDQAAEYLMLYIWGNDSTRSLFRSVGFVNHLKGGSAVRCLFTIFPGSFKPYVEMDLDSGHFVERENLLPTKESLRHLAEPQWLVDHLKGDMAMQLALYACGQIRDLDRERINKLAARLDFTFDWSRESALQSQADALLDRYAQRASLFVLAKARDFAQRNNKKLLVVLFSPDRALPQIIQGRPRFDQEIVDYLLKNNFTYFDMNVAQAMDFRLFNVSYEEYLKLYFSDAQAFPGSPGHYTPRGNHLFAYSIKNKVVAWLDPKPTTYRKTTP